MRQSRLPAGGQNLFQAIKAKKAEVVAKGVRVLNLAIGQPSGAAFMSARQAASKAILSDEESIHEYWDNGSPGCPDFAKRFVQTHLKNKLPEEGVDYLPIPGIKPMLGLIPLASGGPLHNMGLIVTTTNPGYLTPKDWVRYLCGTPIEPELNPDNRFLLSVEDIKIPIGLIMANYPHNPSGSVPNRKWWKNLCRYCQIHNIRLFNDAAYGALMYYKNCCLLSEVAPNFPDLSWAEAFSASKVIGNGTGWRVGAMVGSPDFIGDIKTIKGNTDSGLNGALATGALFALENDKVAISALRGLYFHRIALLCEILESAGMKLACEPQGGFFTLWQTPKFAYGKKIKSAEDFNFSIMEGDGKIGAGGVHFHPYIRYSVAHDDIEAMAGDIKAVFKKAKIRY